MGGGRVAASKLSALLEAAADVTVVAPTIRPELERAGVKVVRRAFTPGDLDGTWFVVAAASRQVNRQVAAAAEERHVFVNAVDDPPNATAYLGGVVRRAGVTIAISTGGRAPALAGLLREGFDAVLPPEDLEGWMAQAQAARQDWLARGVPIAERPPATPPDTRPPVQGKRRGSRGQVRNGTQSVKRMGFVSLIGAGPGDPELLTQKAVKRLAEADLVLFDGLVFPRGARASPAGAAVLRRQACASQSDPPRNHPSAHDPRGAAGVGGSYGSSVGTRSSSAVAARRRWRSGWPACRSKWSPA